MKYLFLFLLFFPLSGAANGTQGTVFDLSEKKIMPLASWEIRAGDQPAWVNSSGSEPAWNKVFFWKAPPDGVRSGPGGRFWLRTSIILQGQKDETDQLALFFMKIPSAFEVFWDGELITGNGRLGKDRFEEIPGKVRGFIRLPGDKASVGLHQLSLRVSNFHIRKKAHEFRMIFGYNSSLVDRLSKKKEENLLYMGLFLTATLFSLFLFLGGWRYFPAVFFSVFTIFQILDNFWAYLLRTDILNVTLFYRLNPVLFSVNNFSFLPLNLFIIWHLEVPRRKALSWILSVISSAASFHPAPVPLEFLATGFRGRICHIGIDFAAIPAENNRQWNGADRVRSLFRQLAGLRAGAAAAFFLF